MCTYIHLHLQLYTCHHFRRSHRTWVFQKDMLAVAGWLFPHHNRLDAVSYDGEYLGLQKNLQPLASPDVHFPSWPAQSAHFGFSAGHVGGGGVASPSQSQPLVSPEVHFPSCPAQSAHLGFSAGHVGGGGVVSPSQSHPFASPDVHLPSAPAQSAHLGFSAGHVGGGGVTSPSQSPTIGLKSSKIHQISSNVMLALTSVRVSRGTLAVCPSAVGTFRHFRGTCWWWWRGFTITVTSIYITRGALALCPSTISTFRPFGRTLWCWCRFTITVTYINVNNGL